MPVITKQYIPATANLNTTNVVTELQKSNFGGVLSKKEAHWANDVMSKFGADPAVKAALGKLFDGVKIQNPALLSPEVAALRTSSPIGVQTGGGIRPQATTSIDVIHFAGASTFESDFKFKDGILKQWYGDCPADKFGTTRVDIAPGMSFEVHDMQYDLGDGKVGMRLIPVADAGGTVVDKDGKTVPGHELIDAFLRKEMGLKPEEPIYVLMSYIHPKDFEGSMKDLGGEKLKTEMGNTHMGAYIGNAKTTNSPGNYHGHTFEAIDDGDEGYPANMAILSLQGVPQAVMNQNMRLVDGALNEGVEFPSNYKEDPFRTIDMPTTMLFYKDWINDASYLHDDNSWATYCAEHKTVVGNVAMNLPHNEAAFKEMFSGNGGAEGAELWKKFTTKYAAREGKAFTAADETSFKPLWQLEGMSLGDVQPWKDKAEYDSYNTARQKGELATYTGRKPPEPGKGMMWPPETTADLMCDFVESYVSFKQAGGFAAAAAILGFKDTITQRMGLTDEQFLGLSVPVINKIMVAEAMVTAPGGSADGWMNKASATLFAMFGGPEAPEGEGQMKLKGLVEMCLQGAKAQIQNITSSPVPDDLAASRSGAHKWLRDAIQIDIEKARRLSVSDGKVEHYSPPAVVQRVGTGIHESSRFVTVKTVCTIVEGSHMQSKTAAATEPAPVG